MEVHKCLGWGLLEAVYQEALAFELDHIGIKYQKEVELPNFTKGLNCKNRIEWTSWLKILLSN